MVQLLGLLVISFLGVKHVIDSSAANAEEQRLAVLQVLDSIGVSKEKIMNRMIEVWNKVCFHVSV